MPTLKPEVASIRIKYKTTFIQEREYDTPASIPTWEESAATLIASTFTTHVYLLPDGTAFNDFPYYEVKDGEVNFSATMRHIHDEKEAAELATDAMRSLVIVGDRAYETRPIPCIYVSNKGRVREDKTGDGQVHLTRVGLQAPLSALPQCLAIAELLDPADEYARDDIEARDLSPLGPPPELDVEAIAAYLRAVRDLRAGNVFADEVACDVEKIRQALADLDAARPAVAHLLADD